MQLPIYLDHSATTPVAPQVMAAMLPYFTEQYGNPSSLYSLGLSARDGVDDARTAVAAALNCARDEVVFTSGGTESDNTALRGVFEAEQARGRHIISSPTEHHAVLETLEALHRQGAEIELCPVESDGRIEPAQIEKRIRPDTILVSLMHANNEIGTIHSIGAIGAICRERKVWFHTDAVQTFGRLPIDVRAMNIDLLSLSAHKLYGPKGIGALYIRRGTPCGRYQQGGQQERGRRGGTLNVPGIVGLGKAAELAVATMECETRRLSTLRDRFIERLAAGVPGTHVMGSTAHRLPGNVHFCIEGVEGESVLLGLDGAGICASAASACTAGSVEPSHVLAAIGIPRNLARGALRFSMGGSTTEEALDYTLASLSCIVSDLRNLSR